MLTPREIEVAKQGIMATNGVGAPTWFDHLTGEP